MEVPFISSGANSRSHYTLVRKVEYANSPQAANQHLSAEVETIQHQLAGPALSLNECRKHLITLLYCYMTVSHGFLPTDAFYFALSHAVTLAEAGHNIGQKRIGYLFCAEVMPQNHELQLMLVNTLRKDLEHEDIPRICLALENVIVSSNEDLVPAIQTRLQDLLSHASPYVRRRALLAYQSLASKHPELLSRIGRKVVSRCGDSEVSVSSAAMALCVRMAKTSRPSIDTRNTVNGLLAKMAGRFTLDNSAFICRILSALDTIGLNTDNIHIVLELIHSSSKGHEYAILRGAFALLANIEPARLQAADSESPVQCIRTLLTSRDPNDVYLFLSCLDCVDPVLWAGTSSQIPAVLDGLEVERTMRLLDSSDSLIRKKTLKLLNRVDLGIVSSYYTKAVQSIPPDLSINDLNGYALRMIEIIEAQSGQDGELYSRELKDMLLRVEEVSLERQPVLETVVDTILTHIQHAGANFTIGFSTSMLTSVTELDSKFSQTMLVIAAALTAEQCRKLSIPPLDIVQGFAYKLPTCIPSVADACLLAMLRVAAECDEIPSPIIDTVTELGQRSKRHLRQRCEQFVTLLANKTNLVGIVKKARSSSLPDFLVALVEANNHQKHPSSPPLMLSSTQLLSASKLRYDAYDTPMSAPKLRDRDISKSPCPPGKSLSNGIESLSRVSSRLSESSADSLSRVLTPGELTLAASRLELDSEMKVSTMVGKSKERPAEDSGLRVDLITLDSPFVADPSDLLGSEDFERLWNSMGGGDVRGWYNGSVDVAIEQMRKVGHVRVQIISKDQGDLKVIVSSSVPGGPQAVLRLKESEDDTCLWRLRCNDSGLVSELKEQLG